MQQGSIFQDVKIKWDGHEYVIPSDKVMRAIGLIEGHVTLKELGEGLSTHTMSLVKLSNAYSEVLTYAGAKNVTPEVVYSSLFKKGLADSAVTNSIMGLLAMMIPPEDIQDKIDGGDKSKEGEHMAATHERNSSRRRSRSR